MNWKLWLRWSWRDLRSRWLQVLAISIIIALGTAIFSGFGGQKEWRVASLDLSYSRLNMYDIHVALADESYVDQAEMLAALSSIEGIQDINLRLIVPTQVDATQDGETILVQGSLLGMDMRQGQPTINTVYINDGNNLTAADDGENKAIIDFKFAKYHGLEAGDTITIAGNATLTIVGTGQTPEYFQIIPEGINFNGQATFAPLYLPAETVQKLTGHVGQINDVVITLAEGANRDQVQAAIKTSLEQSFPEMGVQLDVKEDNDIRNLLYTDAEGDQAIWSIMAYVFLIGASLAVLNLSSRIVQSQRREIGIAMALGVPRWLIAVRPLLFGLQIALGGTVIGIGLGILMVRAFGNLITSLAPLPYWEIGLHTPSLVMGTLIGIFLPVMATLIPTLRAVRVAPIDAIRSGHLIAKGGGFSKLLGYIPLPGKSFTQMPFRNMFRSPWRTLFTVLGISVAIALMALFVGFGDTFGNTLDQIDEAYTYQNENRVDVSLDSLYPAEAENVQAIANQTDADGNPLFAAWEGTLQLGGTLSTATVDERIDSLLSLQAMDSTIWVPKLLEGRLPSEANHIVISEKMASDLEVEVGDSLTLEHPRREGLFAFNLVEDTVEVVGIHDNPMRAVSYMSLAARDMMGVEGLINQVTGVPADGISDNTVREVMFTQPTVNSVQEVSAIGEAFDELMGLFNAFLVVMQVVVIFLAFLITFNSTSINVDERVREIATMFAFGLPIRTVTRMQMIENLTIGILGTIIGIGLGWLMLNNMMAARIEDQLADIHFIVVISPTTLGISAFMGILVVALTPLLSIRKMRRMNIPNQLRIME